MPSLLTALLQECCSGLLEVALMSIAHAGTWSEAECRDHAEAGLETKREEMKLLECGGKVQEFQTEDESMKKSRQGTF